MTTAVIILNWNGTADTLNCLDSLHHMRSRPEEITVVDNGSSDRPAAKIRAAYPGVFVIETGANLGYAEGNNVGIRHALEQGADYVFVLNNDTQVAPDTVDCLLDAAKAHPEAAFFGPKILHREVPDQVQSAGMDLDYLWRSRQRTGGEPDTGAGPLPVRCISGAAVFLRANALRETGLLDPAFFLYREDVDWCLRAWRSGYGVYYVPAARVWHRDHQRSESDLPRMTYYMTRNSLLLMRKHRAGKLRAGLLTLRYAVTVLSWTFRPRWKHKRLERDALLHGLADFYRGRFGQGFA